MTRITVADTPPRHAAFHFPACKTQRRPLPWIALAMLLVVTSNCAMAAWTLVGTGGKGDSTVYVDRATKEQNGNAVTIRALIDLKAPSKLSDGKSFASWEARYEFNCRNRQSRMLAASMHAGNMGKGATTNSVKFEKPGWEAIPPASNGEMLWIYACKTQFSSEQEAQEHCPGDIVVWLNTTSGAIHHKGQRWYGHTKAGAYMCKKEAEALRQHDRK